jgi:hypothetical protein
MISDIGTILKGYISPLSFVDKIGGVVRVVTKTETDSSGRQVRKSFPVDCEVTNEDCLSGKYVDLVPNSKYKSVIYFEDQGIRPITQDVIDFTFEASLKLVCWLNLKKLGKINCSNSALAYLNILKVLPTRYINQTVNTVQYSRIIIKPQGQDIKSPDIFSKYTYDEEKTQFLMYPYDYFSLDIYVQFTVAKDCVPDWVNGEEIICG